MSPRRFLLVLAFLSSGVAAQSQSDALIGAAVRNRPEYDGSDRDRTDVVPVVRYYRGPWFARTTHGMLEAGARLALTRGLDAGLQLAHEQGPLDEDPGASLGAHVEWTGKVGPAPLHLLGRLRRHLDSERGTQLDARLTVGVYEGHGLRAGLFGQATWASGKHFATYYAVHDSGLLYTSVGVLGSYELGRRWLAVATVELRRLADEPARSGLVQDRTASYVAVGLAYRF